MRINGRLLRPSDRAERRLMLSLGIDTVVGLRVPRSQNPFQVARYFRKLAHAGDAALASVRQSVKRTSPKLDGVAA